MKAEKSFLKYHHKNHTYFLETSEKNLSFLQTHPENTLLYPRTIQSCIHNFNSISVYKLSLSIFKELLCLSKFALQEKERARQNSFHINNKWTRKKYRKKIEEKCDDKKSQTLNLKKLQMRFRRRKKLETKG